MAETNNIDVQSIMAEIRAKKTDAPERGEYFEGGQMPGDERPITVDAFSETILYHQIEKINYTWDVSEVEDYTPKNAVKRKFKSLIRRMVMNTMAPRVNAQTVFNGQVTDAFAQTYALAKEHEALKKEIGELKEGVADLMKKLDASGERE